jgi:hypothetical protein
LNETLGTADPLYSLIFEGLWCMADREGRLEDRPLRIHASINPYRPSASTVLALDWLVRERFVIRYVIGGVGYLAVVNFCDHQQPHIKEAPSKIPPPPKVEENQELATAPDKHGASTVLAPEIPALAALNPSSLTPDSGLLNPCIRAPDPAPDKHGASPVLIVPHETSESQIFENVSTIKAKYPKASREDWITAEKLMRQLVTNGDATWLDLEAGVERYRRLCRATNRMVLNPARFFGDVDRPWSQEWPLPRTKAEQAQDSNIDAGRAWLEESARAAQ